MKLTKRKGFNFFRSYYDVYNELENDKDKVAFIDALLDRQFLGIKPIELKGMAKFAYISQTNSIDSQVKGYEDKTGEKLNNITPAVGGTDAPAIGGKITPTVQVQEKVKEKEKEEDIPEFIFFLAYAKEHKPKVDALDVRLKYESWKINNWKDGNGKLIKNWKTKLLNTLPYLKEIQDQNQSYAEKYPGQLAN